MSNINKEIQSWISKYYGLVITEDKIEQKIPQLMTMFDLNESKFLHALNSGNFEIINATIDAFTVQESYFFRDSSLFLSLQNTILPNLINVKKKNGDYQLTIWSAGCSYGEEIYSVAIYLTQLLPDIKQWKINLIATDINESALAKAKKGAFTKSSMRATDNNLIQDFFESNQSQFVLKPKIREMVKFEYGNIADMSHTHRICDLIFCRNVFIYLNPKTIETALHHFYNNLINEGILFIGPSDLITYYHHNFTVEKVNDFYLLKKAIPTQSAFIALPIKSKPIPSISYTQQLQERANQIQAIRLLLDNKQYYQVLEKITCYLSTYKETALLYRYKGEALIGLGDTATAIINLIKSLQLDPLDATTHFLHALAEIDLKNKKNAVVSLQKALYINKEFPEAAYHLALLYLQNDQQDRGIKLLKQSLLYAELQPKEKPVVCANGTMEQFIQAIKANISIYQG